MIQKYLSNLYNSKLITDMFE